jgi:6-phosphogluconate dehydrogenase
MTYQMGIVRPRLMGQNLALNMAHHGYRVAGYGLEVEKLEASSRAAAMGRNLQGVDSYAALMQRRTGCKNRSMT